MRLQTASGIDYLERVTRLAQRIRAEHPTAGVWETADFQWWWRVERESDTLDQVFVTDEDGDPVGASLLTRWPRTWGHDLLTLPSRAEEATAALVPRSVARIEALSGQRVESAVRDDDPLLREALTQVGFEATDNQGAAAWLSIEERPPPIGVADGFQLRDRSEVADRRHHFVSRSAVSVEHRLQQTSLYDPELDLFIQTNDGTVVAYALFWFDPTTSIGVIEPVRTEEGHERQGLARHLLATGLDRLSLLGAERVKVNYEVGNEAAENLYLDVGFEVDSLSTVFTLG